MTELKRKKNQIRYNLHRDVRKEGFELNARKRTIYIYFQNTDLSDKVKRLQTEFNYAVQTQLDDPKQNLR